MRVMPSMNAIYKVNGRVVEGLGDRNGRRAVINTARVASRGGKRVRGEAQKMQWTHPRIRGVVSELLRLDVNEGEDASEEQGDEALTG